MTVKQLLAFMEDYVSTHPKAEDYTIRMPDDLELVHAEFDSKNQRMWVSDQDTG